MLLNTNFVAPSNKQKINRTTNHRVSKTVLNGDDKCKFSPTPSKIYQKQIEILLFINHT